MKLSSAQRWHKGIALLLAAVSLLACGMPATPTPAPKSNPQPTATKRPPTPKPPTQKPPSAVTGGQPSSGAYSFPVPASPPVPFGDVMDIVFFGGTGGPGGAASCPCVNSTSSGAELTEFPPNTAVRVVVYESLGGSHGLYLAQWNLTTNAQGKATIKVSGRSPYKTYVYTVFDAQSGDKLAPRGVALIDVSQSSPTSCKAKDKTRLSVGMTARVTLNGESLFIRYGPYIVKNTVIAELPEGRQMKLLYGPECTSGYVWWLVRTEKYNGWVAEGKKGEWYIEPVK